MIRSAVLVAAVVALTGSVPASAASGGSESFTVTVPDHVWASYACVTLPVAVESRVEAGVPWQLGLSAGLAGGRTLDGAVVIGTGPGSHATDLLVCPVDSDGTWSVAGVGTLLVVNEQTFTLSFVVSRVGTATAITKARYRDGASIVRGSAVSTGATRFAGRAAVRISVRHNGQWREWGTTYARGSGNFTAVFPKKLRKGDAVKAEYLGDPVTNPSAATAKYRP